MGMTRSSYSQAHLGEVGRSQKSGIVSTLILTGIGTEYSAEDVFDLSKMEPYNLEKLYKSFTKVSKHVVLFLPRTSDLNQIARCAENGKKIEVAHYCIKGASKVCMRFNS